MVSRPRNQTVCLLFLSELWAMSSQITLVTTVILLPSPGMENLPNFLFIMKHYPIMKSKKWKGTSLISGV